jgi:hypothetical protein
MDFGIFTMVPTMVPVSPFTLSAPRTGPSVQLREVGTLNSRDCKSWSIHWLKLDIWALSSWHIFMLAHLIPDACIRSVRPNWKQWCRIIETLFSISRSIPAARAARRRSHFCCRLLKVPGLVLGLHCRAGRLTSAFSVLWKKNEKNLVSIIADN